MVTQKIYLAGGFHSDWRKEVKQAFTSRLDIKFIDPKIKETPREFTMDEIGTWDLHYIKQCDICFVYMDKTNPSGYGLSVEIGYAKALGKTVILVLETDHEKIKYLQFLTVVADVTYITLKEGIDFLKTFI